MMHIILIVLTLILLESLLSVDNAAVLALMVKDLPGKQKDKALKYGIIGAYLFRGLCLWFAAWLVSMWWLKIAGGLYLLYLGIGHFTKKVETHEEKKNREDTIIYRSMARIGINSFWSTVILVEFMDLSFSIDNVFAAVAMTPNIYLIMTGVFIGILAMRFVAQRFVRIMEKHPSLEGSAYFVILLLGIKLTVAGLCEWSWIVDAFPVAAHIKSVLENHWTDFIFSIGTLFVFLLPLLSKGKGGDSGGNVALN